MTERFPENFLFGAATSAHQVEGGNSNSDWWEWEQSSARLNALARRGLKPNHLISGRACEHWQRFREDFDIAKNMSHNAHRFSIEWARVEPRQGEWDGGALEHYREVLEALHERSITPLVTLHHFTNPLWFSRMGGWERRDAYEYFGRYVEKVIEKLGHLADYWMPINEPRVLAEGGWREGRWPPQKHSVRLFMRVSHNLLRAHRHAYHIIRDRSGPRAQVGFVAAAAAFRPRFAWNPVEQFLASFARYWSNNFMLLRVQDAMDFIGLNYYRGFDISVLPPWVRELGKERSDLGWGIYPQGLGQILREMKTYHKPIIITENGLADAGDTRRSHFITEHLREVLHALGKGVDVRGYLYWSLLDNFEWADGFSPRFGLVAVDYATQTRTPRRSAQVFSNIIRTRQLP